MNAVGEEIGSAGTIKKREQLQEGIGTFTTGHHKLDKERGENRSKQINI